VIVGHHEAVVVGDDEAGAQAALLVLPRPIVMLGALESREVLTEKALEELAVRRSWCEGIGLTIAFVVSDAAELALAPRNWRSTTTPTTDGETFSARSAKLSGRAAAPAGCAARANMAKSAKVATASLVRREAAPG
jgi:hypothetical protein